MHSFILFVHLFLASPNPAGAEAERLLESSDTRREDAGGVSDLLRYGGLRDWIPHPQYIRSLKKRARDKKRHPLGRAMAWWLLLKDAQDLLATQRGAEAQSALGLLTHFMYRPNSVENPRASVNLDQWQRYPHSPLTGTIRLDQFLRNEELESATLLTRVNAPREGPAILRIGYSDQVTVWWNGDQVYTSAEGHAAWLDQAAVLVQMREGRNRLMVRVTQDNGAWGLVARLTQPNGTPIKVESTWPSESSLPEPIDPPLVADIADFWRQLRSSVGQEPLNIRGLIDLAWYAHHSHLPNREQTVIRLAIAEAFDQEKSPRTLDPVLALSERGDHARFLSEVRKAPVHPEDAFAEAHIRLIMAWEHHYAGRSALAWRETTSLIETYPDYEAAHRFLAVLHEQAELKQAAYALSKSRYQKQPDLLGTSKAYASSLQSAGRVREETDFLLQQSNRQFLAADEWIRLVDLWSRSKEWTKAIELIDTIVKTMPDLWFLDIQAVELLRDHNQTDKAEQRLESLVARFPKDLRVLRLQVQAALKVGDINRAKAVLATVDDDDPETEDLTALLAQLTQTRSMPNLGPPIAELDSPCLDGPAQVQFQIARTDITQGGRADRWVRRVLKICEKAGAEAFGEMDVFYATDTQRLTIVRARRYRDGQWRRAKRTSRSLSQPENRFYFDLRAETLRFMDARPGDIIDVIWRVTDIVSHPAMPNDYGEVAYLQGALPRLHSVVEYAESLPGNLHVAIQSNGLEILETPGRIEARNVPAIQPLERAPGPTEARAHVHLSTQKSWTEVENAYVNLLGRRGQIGPALRKEAKRIIQGADTDVQKLERLYRYIADEIRYVALEFGIHSFQPAAPETTWSRKYGDCKDKAILLVAMLRSVGIDAHFTLVRTRTAGRAMNSPASLAVFDHAMLYLPKWDRFVDPTVPLNEVWTLPSPDYGAQVLVMGEGRLRTVPFPQAAAHGMSWNFELRMTIRGLEGWGEMKAHGVHAGALRRHLNDGRTRQRGIDGQVRRLLPGHGLVAPTITGLNPKNGPLVISGRLSRSDVPSAPMKEWTLGLQEWQLMAKWAEADQRTEELRIPYPHFQRVAYTLTLPPSRQINPPKDVFLDSPFGHFDVRFSQAKESPHHLRVELEFWMDSVEISPDEYGHFRDWLRQVDAILVSQIPLEYEEI